MKISRLILPTFMLGALIFAGCAPIEEAGPVTTDQPPAGQTETETGAERAEQPGDPTENVEMVENVVPEPEISAADAALINSALRLNDAQYCNEITDEEVRQNCLTRLEDKQVMAEAVANLDASRCDALSSEDSRTACEIEVETEMNVQTEREGEQQMQVSDDARMEAILESGDHTRCQELQLENSILDCELNILTNKAVQENNIAICDQASTENAQTICRENFAMVAET